MNNIHFSQMVHAPYHGRNLVGGEMPTQYFSTQEQFFYNEFRDKIRGKKISKTFIFVVLTQKKLNKPIFPLTDPFLN